LTAKNTEDFSADYADSADCLSFFSAFLVPSPKRYGASETASSAVSTRQLLREKRRCTAQSLNDKVRDGVILTF